MITEKANSVRAFLQQNTKMCPINIKDKCNTIYVRPIVEYASPVLDPVQRRAARCVFLDFHKQGEQSDVHDTTTRLANAACKAVSSKNRDDVQKSE